MKTSHDLNITRRLASRHMLLCALLTVSCLRVGAAQDLSLISEKEAPYLSKPEGVVNLLRWVNQGLRTRVLRLNPSAPLTRVESDALLQRATLALLGGEDVEMIYELRGALERSQLERDPNYPLLLIKLAQAERRQGLNKSAARHTTRALEVGAASKYRYERALIEALKGELIGDAELPKRWAQYRALCARYGKAPSEALWYMFGKAHFLAGQTAESERFMSHLKQGRLFKARAEFFLGLIALKKGELKEAKRTFKALSVRLSRQEKRARAKRRAAGQEVFQLEKSTPQELTESFGLQPTFEVKPPMLKVECVLEPNAEEGACPGRQPKQGPPSVWSALYGDDQELRETAERLERELLIDQRVRGGDKDEGYELPPREGPATLNGVSSALNITRARLALIDEDYDRAWRHYRGVPLYSAWSEEALLEGVYLLRARGAYAHAARLLDQVMKTRDSDETLFNLNLWSVELKYKASQEQEAARHQESMINDLVRTREVVESSQGPSLLFPADILAWIDDQDAKVIQRLQTQYESLKIELIIVQETLKRLSQVVRSNELPSIEDARRFFKVQRASLFKLSRELPALREAWARWSRERPAPILGLASQEITTSLVQESVRRLEGRLAQLEQLADRRAEDLRRTLPKLLKELQAELRRHQAQFSRLGEALNRLDQSTKREALSRVKSAEARLLLSPTESSFWDKERLSEQLTELYNLQRGELEPLRDLSALAENSQAQPSVLEVLMPFVQPEAKASGTGEPSRSEEPEPEPLEPSSAEEPLEDELEEPLTLE